MLTDLAKPDPTCITDISKPRRCALSKITFLPSFENFIRQRGLSSYERATSVDIDADELPILPPLCFENSSLYEPEPLQQHPPPFPPHLTHNPCVEAFDGSPIISHPAQFDSVPRLAPSIFPFIPPKVPFDDARSLPFNVPVVLANSNQPAYRNNEKSILLTAPAPDHSASEGGIIALARDNVPPAPFKVPRRLRTGIVPFRSARTRDLTKHDERIFSLLDQRSREHVFPQHRALQIAELSKIGQTPEPKRIVSLDRPKSSGWFECLMCPKSFKRKHDLRRHISICHENVS